MLTPLVALQSARAQGLLITDCQGFTRALTQLEPGQVGKVEFQINDAFGNPMDGVQVELTNTATGEVTTTVTQNGVATFQNVSAGSFSVGSPVSGASVGAVSVTSAGAAAVAGTTTAVAVGTAAAGGATAGVVAVSTEVANQIDNNNKDSATPTPTPTPTASPNPSPTPTPQASAPTPTPTPVEDCCDPDAQPTPIDDGEFFPQDPLSPSS